MRKLEEILCFVLLLAMFSLPIFPLEPRARTVIALEIFGLVMLLETRRLENE